MEPNKLNGWYEKLSEMLSDRTHCRVPLSLAYADLLKRELEIGIMPDHSVSADEYRRIIRQYIPGVPFRLVFFKPERHANKQQYNRPIKGGIIIRTAGGSAGTLGLVVKNNGTLGFVSAGHVLEKKLTEIYQPQKSNKNDWQIGEVTKVSDYLGNKTLSDSGFAKLATSKKNSPPGALIARIWKTASASYIVTSSTPVDKLSEKNVVSMQGAGSNKTSLNKGMIVSLDATVSFYGGGSQKKQIITDYMSRQGDSGAPVFLGNGSSEKVSIIGLNLGSSKINSIDPKPEKYKPNSKTDEYAVVSPWANIVADIGPLSFS